MLVVDTQAVKRGQVLVKIDDTDAKVALDQAQAQLGQAERKVRGYFANDDALAGQVAARQADITSADAQIASAQADLDRASTELGRRQAWPPRAPSPATSSPRPRTSSAPPRRPLTQARAAKAQAMADTTARRRRPQQSTTR